ncbi:WecB/TagA/CpsF family glycosyltransferase [Cognaticolwellia beringensis]|uniref:Glycosyltransferase n=1 Tax=Cognaticolwellia beringensis TaxID=1967665 RepID=A0A222G5L3_9GAMM|nr:WecB/TagA/CpsF family glycosyltransferase [Cognaticolwellia beringensis]ASP46644.1 glycosyltransferase [Cognaticolwellia beringensis]
MYKTINLMGYDVFNDDISLIDIGKSQGLIVNTINPHSYVTAKSDTLFKEALLSSDTLIADGSGIVLAAQKIHNISMKKIAGADLHHYLLLELNKTNGTVFYMGAAPSTLVKIHEKTSVEFPNITVESYSPPFKSDFSTVDNEIIINKINTFNPDVLFIGMTAPKQEKWLYQHKGKLNFKVASSIGAVFDFYAGTVDRPSPFWIKIHLEWLPRLLKEPRRLWRRNFISTPIFLFDMFLYKFGYKKN